MSELRQKYNK